MMADPCFRCDQPLRRAAGWVHLKTDGRVVPTATVLAPEEDQGWFPVGPDCVDRYPAEQVRLGDDW